MAKLLFKLSGVPDDEIEGVRNALEAEEIDYYETSSGLLGLSFAAIWIKQDEQYAQAKQTLNDYQKTRYKTAKQKQFDDIEKGENITWWQAFKSSPIRSLLSIIFVMAILYIAIIPFFPIK